MHGRARPNLTGRLLKERRERSSPIVKHGRRSFVPSVDATSNPMFYSTVATREREMRDGVRGMVGAAGGGDRERCIDVETSDPSNAAGHSPASEYGFKPFERGRARARPVNFMRARTTRRVSPRTDARRFPSSEFARVDSSHVGQRRRITYRGYANCALRVTSRKIYRLATVMEYVARGG